jgi:hypothetical protein
MKFFPVILGMRKYPSNETGKKKYIKIKLEKTMKLLIGKCGKLKIEFPMQMHK